MPASAAVDLSGDLRRSTGGHDASIGSGLLSAPEIGDQLGHEPVSMRQDVRVPADDACTHRVNLAQCQGCEPWCSAPGRIRTCGLAITRNHYRTAPVMTEQFVWPARTLLNNAHLHRTFTVVSGR